MRSRATSMGAPLMPVARGPAPAAGQPWQLQGIGRELGELGRVGLLRALQLLNLLGRRGRWRLGQAGNQVRDKPGPLVDGSLQVRGAVGSAFRLLAQLLRDDVQHVFDARLETLADLFTTSEELRDSLEGVAVDDGQLGRLAHHACTTEASPGPPGLGARLLHHHTPCQPECSARPMRPFLRRPCTDRAGDRHGTRLPSSESNTRVQRSGDCWGKGGGACTHDAPAKAGTAATHVLIRVSKTRQRSQMPVCHLRRLAIHPFFGEKCLVAPANFTIGSLRSRMPSRSKRLTYQGTELTS